MEGNRDSQTIDDYLNKLAVQNAGQTTTNTLAKLRAVKLQSYWKRICEDEKRSKQRNAQLLRDLDRMEANMASLDAKREKLKHMKEQYFQYIERTYPKWLELVQQKKREYLQQQEQQQQQQYQQQQQQYQQQQQQYQQQQQQYQQQQLGRSGGYEVQEGYSETASQQQYKPRVGEKSGTPDRQQTVPKQQEAYHPQHYQDRRHSYQDEDEDEDSPPPLPSQPPPKVAFSGPEREYTNLRDLRRDSESQKLAVPSQPASVVQKSAVLSQPASVVTVHMPSVGREAPSPSKSSRPGSAKKGEHANQNWVAAERDASISYSEEIEIRPIQSVTVRQKTEPPKPQGPQGPMMGSLSDDDVSDFGEEPDLPSGAGSVPEGAGVKPSSLESPGRDEVDEEEDTDQTLSTVHPEISTAGLFRLLKFVEEEVMSALAVEGFYRTRSPNEATRKDIIFKANNASSSLKGMDGELVSMVILHQLTLVLRRLPGACMLSDTLLVRRANTLTEAEVRSNLHRDAQELWDRLTEHFITLVRNRVMGTREVAHVFVPCLVHGGSEHQAKAVSVMEAVIESTLFKEDRNTSPVQDSLTVDTARSSQQGGGDYMLKLTVPPLKFGSLVDSKPFSDEESSIITQSMNTDVQKVPLNETDAYKSLVSGTRPPVRTASHDDTDNSDNELEKQIASTLSPRSMGSKSHNELIREVPYEDSKDESPDLSHEQVPLSEVSSPLAPPVYVPTGTPQRDIIMNFNQIKTGRVLLASTGKSALGSTGGSSQQRKLAGMLSSDLDSDTEVDIEHMVQKKPQQDDDDDFYDFYG